MSLKQLQNPQTGDKIAVMHTTMGDIKIKLFPEYAPKTVENFSVHSENGYYNGIIFHRIIDGFMIQGGDPTGTGMGGESIWGKSFKDEFSKELHNFRGALCMANSGPNTNGSQFFIVQADTVPENLVDQMIELPDMFSAECVEAYKQIGGTPWLDYRHSVFGQVFEGMDVVDAMAKVKTNSSDKPLEDISITNIEIITF